MSRSTGGDVIPDELFKLVKDDAVKVLHSIRQQIWKSRQWPQDWKRSVFIPIPRKCNAKEWSNYHAIVLISHATKAVLKILLVRLQQYVNREILDLQAGFRKDRKQRSNCQHPLDHRASLVAQLVKNPATMQETWVWSLGWEDPLEKGTATHSSILAWRIPWTV